MGKNTAELLGTNLFFRSFATGRLISYESAARTLLEEVGIPTEAAQEDALQFHPTDDTRAYDVIAEHAPEVAQAIEDAAERVRTPFWRISAVRNAMAWMVFGIVLAAYVGGVILPFPWNAIVPGVLATAGVTGPSAPCLKL